VKTLKKILKKNKERRARDCDSIEGEEGETTTSVTAHEEKTTKTLIFVMAI